MLKWLSKPKLTTIKIEYLEANKHKLAANTIRLTEHAWAELVEVIGDIPITKFTRAKAEEVQAHWCRRTSPVTARIYRKSVSPLFSWAIIKKYIKDNPFEDVRLPKCVKRQVRVYSNEEFRRLLNACRSREWVAILLLARTTGMRKTTIQNLTRTDIDFENKTISVREKKDTDFTWPWVSKGREERPLPLLLPVANVLTELMYDRPLSQPYLLPKPSRYYHLLEMKKLGCMTDEMRLHPVSNFDRTFRKIKARANVVGRFHDLRATCLTDLAEDLTIAELKLISGHSDVETTMRYIGVERDVVNKARKQVNKSLHDILTPSHALSPN